MKSLKALLRPLRVKIFTEGLLMYLLYTMAGGGVICGVIKLLGKFVYSVGAWANDACIAVMIFSVVCGVIMAFLRRPGDSEVARSGDALGYKERLVTALEILSQNDEPKGTEKLVVEDALKAVTGGELRRSYKMKISKRAMICALCAVIFFVGSGFIPVPEKLVQQFTQRQELEDKITEEIEKLDEAVKEGLDSLPDEQRAEVEQRLEELKEELKGAESENGAIEALERAQEDIQRIENETAEDLQAVGDALAQNQAAGLGDALASGDISADSEALQNATAEEQAAAADALNQAAEELAADSELGQALKEAAEALKNGDSSAIASSLDNLQDAYNDAADNAAKGSSGTSGINNAVSDAAKNIKGAQQEGSGQNGSGGSQSGGGTQSGSSGSQSGSGGSGAQSGSSGSQSGSGTQSGSGGSQSGSGGSGVQSGSSGSGTQSGSSGSQSGSDGSGTQSGSGDSQSGSGSQGGSAASGNASGSGQGSGHIPDEQIYSRGAEDMGSYDAQLEGYEGEAGEYVTEERQAIGTGGEVPYSEVYNEYKDAALESLNDSSVPNGLQDIVREYFSTLE